MKKIAILTQPIGFNYGGIIQNYALQFTLKKMGYEVITIAREYEKVSRIKLLLHKAKTTILNSLNNDKIKIFSDDEKNYIASEMFRFIKDKINISEKLYTDNDISTYFKTNKFDIVVVGSDQTWRPKYSPNIYNYFLDFLINDKAIIKIAYASSFGTDQWEFDEEQTKRCSELAKEFNAISVREKPAINLCDIYLKVKADWVLDPTLLLKKEEYISLFKEEKNINVGMFNYVLDQDVTKQNFIKEIASTLNLKHFNCQPKRSLTDKLNFTNIDDYKFPSLEKWLKSFHDAEFIVTDSFHGTVFSIIFKKPFISIINQDRGASRFYSLLNALGLEDRLVTDVNNFDAEILQKPINYDTVNNKLEDLKKSSYEFLEKNLK